jgi:putative spermidine/putrescine transport system ATP-binding protein
MRAGRIVQDGPPLEAYSEPVDAFVAGFVGETNLLAGIVEASRDGDRVALGDGRLSLPAGDAFSPGDEVMVSIRPEHLSLVVADGGDALLEGRVLSASFLGYEVLFDVETPIGLLRVRWISSAGPLPAHEGDRVGLACAVDRVRIFPRGETAT